MMKGRLGLLGILCLTLAGAAVSATAAEFSATMVQKAPNQRDMKSRIYVSGDMMREETTVQGQKRIRIHDKSSNTMWLMNPQEKEYVELSGKPGKTSAPDEPPLPDEKDSPCQQPSSGLSCTKIGVEKINGRKAEKWRFTATKGQRETQWTEWFDKSLRVPIRGEGPSGMVRELSNIEVGPQPSELFQVPSDYEKIEMPSRGGRGPQGGYRQP